MAETKYQDAPKQSEYPTQACSRAAWVLNSLGQDVKYKRLSMKEFNAAYSAVQSLNIPVQCKAKGAGGKKSVECFCYRPLSGIVGARKAKRRKRK